MSVVCSEHNYESLAYSAIKLALFVLFNALEKKKKSVNFFSQLFLVEEKHTIHLGLQESSSKPLQIINTLIC